MSTNFELSAATRTDKGKGASRRLRREADLVPAVIYGAGKDAVSISLEHRFVIKALENEAFYTQVIDLSIDGKAQQVVLKDLQRHPFRPRIMHMDFLRIKAGEKINMTIPFHFIGEDVAPGVKLDGGVVSRVTSEAEVSCLPQHLPEFIEVDVSEMKMDELLHLSDIRISKDIEFTALAHENDPAVVSIHKARAEVIEEDAPETPDAPDSDVSENKDKADE
jgi:large subunit ribosomal protein L25